MRRAVAAAAVTAALALTGCGSSDQPTTSDETPAAAPSDSSGASKTIDIEIKGDSVEPNGERVQVAAGRPIRLHVESDRAAELHVHSSPEQELELKKGESTLSLTVDTPGIVEVEEHDSGVVVLQLEVR
ncbi:MAG TPA: hypothetical protein VF165_01685 [Nocardioidaceae bacterium]